MRMEVFKQYFRFKVVLPLFLSIQTDHGLGLNATDAPATPTPAACGRGQRVRVESPPDSPEPQNSPQQTRRRTRNTRARQSPKHAGNTATLATRCQNRQQLPPTDINQGSNVQSPLANPTTATANNIAGPQNPATPTADINNNPFLDNGTHPLHTPRSTICRHPADVTTLMRSTPHAGPHAPPSSCRRRRQSLTAGPAGNHNQHKAHDIWTFIHVENDGRRQCRFCE